MNSLRSCITSGFLLSRVLKEKTFSGKSIHIFRTYITTADQHFHNGVSTSLREIKLENPKYN